MPTDAELLGIYAHPVSSRPWVRTNFVSTVDGAVQDSTGVSGSFGGQADFRAFRVMRSLADVIVVGAGTTRAEGYEPVRADELLPGSSVPPIAIVSSQLDIPEALVAPGQVLITHHGSDPDRRAELAETMDVITAGETEVDWPDVLDEFAQRGWFKVLCEGGPHLHGDLLRADAVDELCVTIAPTVAAGDALRVAVSAAPVELALTLAHWHVEDNVILTRWVRSDRAAREDN